MSFFPKNKRGQHFLEYSVLLVSIMAGIVIAGPYVIRSWNALLKGYDTDVRDSFTDPLMTAPSEPTGCACEEEWLDGICGAGECSPYQKYQYRICYPFDCDVSQRCVDDPTCCPWSNDRCGGTNCDGSKCEASEMRQTTTCSPDPAVCGGPVPMQERCVADYPMCSLCTGTFDPRFYCQQQLCVDDIKDVDPPIPFEAVTACTNRKCEFLCIPPFIPSEPDHERCVCPDGTDGIPMDTDSNCHTCDCPEDFSFFSQKWSEDWDEDDGPSDWQGGDCPAGMIVRGIHTFNKDAKWKHLGGHNQWWFTCRQLDASCFTGVSSTTESFFVNGCDDNNDGGTYPDLVGAQCPPGQVMTGLWSINSTLETGPVSQSGRVESGENWFRLDCQAVNSSCIGSDAYNGYPDRFNQWSKPEVRQISKTCYVTGIHTLSLPSSSEPHGCEPGNNEWWLEANPY
jgi:hypothetical protein